ncbi:MAG: crossover junction endodeoxyribonuclease RuvC [Bacillota bacterium]|nr:crossover junction endodeoxyribonuclease RuvC [Bacillota bacterium]
MIVLGIDPGYAIIGYGLIQNKSDSFIPLAYGAITTDAEMDFNSRLEYIYDCMIEVLQKSKPDAMAIESLYFHTNQKTAIMVAEARGVILLAAKKMNVPIFEYTPLQVKSVITGHGRAKKQQMIDMTGRLLKITEPIKPDDTADALALAICHTRAAGTELREMMFKRGIK